MKPIQKVPHEWSPDALLVKAQRYAEVMLKQDRDNWQFGFWSVMILEILLKAAISNVAPALIADSKEWENIYFALGKPHPKGKPKTAMMSELIKRAETIFPGFSREMQNFCSKHCERRNADLHSGALPFDNLKTSEWLADFYATCEFLLSLSKKKLAFLFASDEAKTAKKMIKGLNDDAAKSVAKKIAKHKTSWAKKTKADKTLLTRKASLLSSRSDGHRAKCPACGSEALTRGSPSGQPNISSSEDVVTVRTPMLPSHFWCNACQLKISGFSRLNAAKLGDIYTSTVEYDAIDFYGTREVDEWDGYEEDNNEP